MDNNNMLKLCRLCLVKDDVNIPIFEEQGDIRQIFLKISSCLPVKVSRDDQLPKKICDGCSYKLDMLYEFWNTSANAEKQLLTWLGEAGMSSQMADGTISAVAQQIKPADAFVKQETIDPPDIHMDDDDDDDEEDKDYMKQEDNSNNVEEPPPKRARRTAAVKAAIALDQNSDDDDDSGEPMTKVEDDSEDSDNEDHEPAFVDVPSTSADDQPGPSGVGKDGVEAPKQKINYKKLNLTYNSSGRKRKETIQTNALNQKSRKTSPHPPPLLLEDPLQCDDCTATFNNNVDFAFHSLVHSKDNKYTCHLCNYKNSYKYKIGIHVRTHEGTNKFKCETCGKGFMGQKQAEEHKNFHTGEMPFQCEICGKYFMFSSRLASHRRSYHYEVLTGKPLVKFDCIECKKHYKSAEGLRTHIIKIHKANEIDLTVICEICGKKLANKKRLKFHLRIHTGYKPFACHICPKNFSKKDQLIEHIRTHTGEKPYVCKLCGKGFAQRTPLKTHEKTHNVDRPGNACNLCRFVFKSKIELEYHAKLCYSAAQTHCNKT
ncbi:zinc finger protein 684-like isoform X26 [Diorhabda carinulata]|uniref:zinc finger protein 684-like isoform X26 n=1 Tax=Diorhabda carinulata TaxID=1163345 RepID=UPI0025A0280E|nr:zinc finger protein 684-like isoform X26 [Diorhabda carinulata]